MHHVPTRRLTRRSWQVLAVVAVLLGTLSITSAPAGADDPPPGPAPIPEDLWSPTDAPATGNHLFLADPSRSADEIYGQGYTSDANGPTFRVGADDDGDFEQTSITISGGTGISQLETGLYSWHGADWVPFVPRLELYQRGRSCADASGWFAVDEVAYHGDELDRISFRFSQTCEDPSASRKGQVSWIGPPSVLDSTRSGPRRGGWKLQILGDHLSEATSLTIDGEDTPFTVDPPVVTAIAPETSLGTHHVVLTTPGGSVERSFESLPNPTTAPQALTADVGKTSVSLTWTPPADVGDAPVDLVQVWVRAAPGSGGPPASAILGPDDETAQTFRRLIPGRSYLARVTYQTAIGLGEFAEIPFSIPPLEHAPFIEIDTLIDQQYTDFVGRPATASERTAATASLRNGDLTPDEWVAAMRNRPEWGGVRAPVTRLYSSYFDRLPDAGGLTYWANRQRSGTSLAKVSATFAASSEFKRKYGSLSNGAFVDLIYRNVLHRTPDASGRTYWIRKLNRGADRGSVMASFSESSEHVRKMTPTVDAVLLYTGMLRRMPTPGELAPAPSASVRTAADAPAADPVALAEQLRHSGAYADRF